ncbi:MAG: OmpA family protein [Bdellovibrionales bacterium]|nr:OmpA family protein [Bdellovibrionales bacterium]
MAISSFLKKAQAIQDDLQARKGQEPPKKAADDESNWLVSYADMMTLLCGFFIMMFSMSTLDKRKFEPVRESVAQAFGGDYKSESAETARFVTQLVESNGVEKDVVIYSEPEGVAMVFHSTLFFDTLSANVTEQGRSVLRSIMDALSERQYMEMKKFRIVVEGHTDGRPVLSGPYPTNWELSAARASRVVRLFVERGFDPENLLAIGYGDTRPWVPERLNDGKVDSNATMRNRRVVLRILEPATDTIPWDGARDPAAMPAAE